MIRLVSNTEEIISLALSQMRSKSEKRLGNCFELRVKVRDGNVMGGAEGNHFYIELESDPPDDPCIDQWLEEFADGNDDISARVSSEDKIM